MASQLYARYVPPTKKSAAPSESPRTIESASSPPRPAALDTPARQQATTLPDASSTYARYIPTNSSTKRQDVTPLKEAHEEALTPSQKRKHDDGTTVTDRAKRVKKSKASTGGSTEAAPHESDNQNLITDGATKKFSKKEKRKKEEREPPSTAVEAAETAEVADEEDDQRHKTLLAKRAKSLKKTERVARRTAEIAAELGKTEEEPVAEEPQELHALEPLPQPEPVPEPVGRATFATLPDWIASPIRVSLHASASFEELGIPSEAAAVLQSKGFENAFAVQAAVLPLLLQKDPSKQGDVLVSAATGSGKTLSYVLPMVKDISNTKIPRLRGLIVMPTRELVQQAREVCELCATAFSKSKHRRIITGVAVGNQTLKAEQASLVSCDQTFDPEGYSRLERKVNSIFEPDSEGSQDSSDLSSLGQESLLQREPILEQPDSLDTYSPKVDILICTPGRLVEHLKVTPGFTLEKVKWLVVDEADKLLGQSFQQWLEIVMTSLPKDDRYRTRKIVLSATITRDLSQLAPLKLRHERLVMLEGSGSSGQSEEARNSSADLNLPGTLLESAVKVAEDGDKPLYLLHLLGMGLLDESAHPESVKTEKVQQKPEDSNSDSSSSDSQSDSSSDSDSDDSSYTSSDSSSEDDTSSDESSSTVSSDAKPSSRLGTTNIPSSPANTPRGILIFTKSNENALRLSRLIALIEPTLSASIGTLTSTIRNSTRRKTLAAFNQRKISILVASDLVARGLDLPNLAHVINYDMPKNLTNYVHRVGRTARAGNQGHAWTLFTNTEARWFWHEIARTERVRRAEGRKVARVDIDGKVFGEERRRVYEEALETLGQEARQG